MFAGKNKTKIAGLVVFTHRARSALQCGDRCGSLGRVSTFILTLLNFFC